MNAPSSVPTELLPPTPQNIARAAEALRAGGLVAFPTETVYGLGAAAENASAVRAMFAAKGRPANHPVIVHLADSGEIDDWAREVPPFARKLAEAFWPGPMTLILPRSKRASDLVTGGLDTVGLRVPAHPVARALLKEFGGGIAAPSANRFGRVSPTSAVHVFDELAGRVPLILDGGTCSVGLESTIIDCSREKPAILRPGAVTAEQIAAVLGRPPDGDAASAPRAPGTLPSHYAPRARVEIVLTADVVERARRLLAEGKRVAVLTLASDSQQADLQLAGAIVIPLPSDDDEQAQMLYALLRRVDELECDVALVTLPPAGGLRTAIADRLRRAAGPRDDE